MIKIIAILLLIPSIALATDKVVLIEASNNQGSGVIISPNGLIITAAHVIGDKRTVTVYKGNKSYNAPVAYIDKKTDIALLKIDVKEHPFSKIQYNYNVSDQVYTLSNPKFYRNKSINGIVDMKVEGHPILFIETDSEVKGGSSGGGVFDQNGDLISIIISNFTGSGTLVSMPLGHIKTTINHYINNLI